MEKPEEIFHIIEHFCLGRRRLHLFGTDNTIRPGEGVGEEGGERGLNLESDSGGHLLIKNALELNQFPDLLFCTFNLEEFHCTSELTLQALLGIVPLLLIFAFSSLL